VKITGRPSGARFFVRQLCAAAGGATPTVMIALFRDGTLKVVPVPKSIRTIPLIAHDISYVARKRGG
jgi:hypothetical protein